MKGRKVKYASKGSLYTIYNYDFINCTELHKPSPEAAFQSLTHGVPEELKQRVRDAMSLLPLRIKILENYVYYIDNTPTLSISNSGLPYYFDNHNFKGDRVKKDSRDSLRSFYIYDFVNRKKIDKPSDAAAFESLTHGIPEELKQRVRDAMSLLPVRIRILENYTKYVDSTHTLKIKNLTLNNYLCSHNLKGRKVRYGRGGSLVRFYMYDFVNNRIMNKFSIEAAFQSLTHGVPEELKQRVRDYMSLLPIRIKILENYANYVENAPNLKKDNSTLSYYFRHHNIKGKKIREGSRNSLINLYGYDFINNTVMDKVNPQSAFEPLTFGIPDALKQRVRNAMTLLPFRIKILENYIEYVEDGPNPRHSNLAYYLFNYNLKGKKVKTGSANSLTRFYYYDHNINREFKLSIEAAFQSLTYGVPEELKQRVRDAMSMLHVRKRILENYVHYIENTPNLKVKSRTLGNYMGYHDINGRKVQYGCKDSLINFYKHDFITNRRMVKADRELAFKSLTYGIQDQELVAKVRRYAFGKIAA